MGPVPGMGARAWALGRGASVDDERNGAHMGAFSDQFEMFYRSQGNYQGSYSF